VGDTGLDFSKIVDIYKNDDTLRRTNDEFTGPARVSLAAATIRCNNGNEYALFGGGNYFNGSFVYSNNVDIFACNTDGVYHKKLTQFTGPGRADLAATTITVDGNQYALFMGGETADGPSDAIDIYDCVSGNFLPQP
jgi:hypothetical protein